MEVLVTGGANGIGKAAVEMLLEEDHGVKVIDHDREALESLPGDVEKHFMDVRDEDSAETVREMDLDGLVNCAGFQEQGSVEDMPLEIFRKHLETNYFGTVRMVKAAIPALKENDGRIVNVSSIAGFATIPFLGAYSASKHAVEGFSDALRMEVKRFGVDVVIVEPGPVNTGFNRRGREALEKYLPGSQYSAHYRERVEGEGFSGVPPEKPAEAVVEALQAENPSNRYRVTWQALITSKLKPLIPSKFYDRIAGRF